MARPKPRADIAPRIWTEEETAHRLGMSVATFRKRLQDLQCAGLPARDSLLDGYDSAAVELWLDRRAGIMPPPEAAGRTGKRLGEIRW